MVKRFMSSAIVVSTEIKAARKAANLTQQEAADLLSVSVRTWQSWEAREGLANHRKMPRMAWELFQIKSTQPRNTC